MTICIQICQQKRTLKNLSHFLRTDPTNKSQKHVDLVTLRFCNQRELINQRLGNLSAFDGCLFTFFQRHGKAKV